MRRLFPGLLLCLLAVVTPIDAGVLAPGRYNGIVHFDRWGGCYLHSGVYVMYVSEQIKASLREYAGKAIQVKVLDVSQPVNPGDALITKLRVLGPAKQTPASRAAAAVRLAAQPVFGAGSASFRLIITNSGAASLSLEASELSFTVLMKNDPGCPPSLAVPFGTPGDGPSFALITRAPINWVGLHGEQARPGNSGSWCSTKYSWHVPTPIPATLGLAPSESREVDVTLELPPGEFELFLGYGGDVFAERSYASSSVFFNVDETGVEREVP